jgi:acyl-CoA dehydrogenase
MLDDFDITHRRGDLPPEVWDFLKSKGFFAMIIPKRYGGLEFGAYAHSCVLVKLAGHSVTAASTVAVPNSLGPGELLNHYGTEEQKNHYLPRLARGEDIPCFALTGPRVGSDAAAIPDTGVVCRGVYQGREVVGLRLNFSKRYITLAPIATVVGLAFRMFDPDKLVGDKADIGITCALLPRETPGITIGRRHLPLNIPFQNGPIQGQDVFVPLDCIIGGLAMAGQGWRMLVEQLSVDLTTGQHHRQCVGGDVSHQRLRAHPPPVQHASGPLRRRPVGDCAHAGPQLHHECGAQRDHGGH